MMSDDDRASGVRRFEVFTGRGRRREWPAAVKASIVAETCSGRETVCAVARRHGLSPSQLFAWRRQLRVPAVEGPAFVPAMLVPGVPPEPAGLEPVSAVTTMELEIDGARMRIAHADATVIRTVIAAPKAPR